MENRLDLKLIIEGVIFASDQPLTAEQLVKLLSPEWTVDKENVREVIQMLIEEYEGRGVELKEVATGFRFQVNKHLSSFIGRLWQERPPKYSRAFLETLALIVYRQPITRAEIEEVRGVAVSSTIIKTLIERDWIRIIGYKGVPGKPALYATTKNFLNDFNLKSLSELPPLAEILNIEQIAEKAHQYIETPAIDSLQSTEMAISEAFLDAEEIS